MGDDEVTLDDFNGFEAFFRDYVDGFCSDDEVVRENLELKKGHTFRVLGEMRTIAGSLGVEGNDLLLAETIALFHDVGRFQQFYKYRTFYDGASENHAELGLKVLQEKQVLAGLPEEERELVTKAVRYHNRLKVPADESPRCLRFCRMIRDADKLDIYRVLTDYYAVLDTDPNPTLEHHLPDGPCAEAIVEDVLACRNSSYELIRTRYDVRLMTLTWVFDVNHQVTMDLIRERGYVEKTLAVLPADENMRRVAETLERYMGAPVGSGIHP